MTSRIINLPMTLCSAVLIAMTISGCTGSRSSAQAEPQATSNQPPAVPGAAAADELHAGPAATDTTASLPQQVRDRATRLRGNMGTNWAVKLPNGKSDVWSVTEVNEMGVTEMKDKAGHSMSVIVGDSGNVTVLAEDCMLTGKLEGGSVTGTSSLASCPMGSGAWSATIQK